MYKKIIFSTLFILYAFVSFAQDTKAISEPDSSFNDDYYVGLKAYEDGLNDVARVSLEKYLAHENKSNKAGFAYYILYQLYMAKNDYKSAQSVFSKVSTFKDNRFNQEKMLKDQMFIEVKLSCNGAKNLLLTKPINEYMEVYIKSSCDLDKDITALFSKTDFSSDVVYSILNRVQDNKELVFSMYNNISPNKRTDKLMDFFGKYFYSKGMKDEFYTLYSEYQSAALTDLILEDVWNTKDYTKYVDTFNKYTGEYKNFVLSNTSYCRMIEASNKSGINFYCNLVDKCLGKKHNDYNKTKLACFMRKEDKKNIASFISALSVKEAESLCEYGKYIIGRNLYHKSFLYKFNGCSDKVFMYESLLKLRDYEGIINLAGKGSTQLDYAYLAIAYKLTGNTADYNTCINKVTDIDLSGMVKRVTTVK